MEDSKPCEHPSCKCLVAPGGEFGGYCSQHCQEAEDLIELRCDCMHPGCD